MKARPFIAIVQVIQGGDALDYQRLIAAVDEASAKLVAQRIAETLKGQPPLPHASTAGIECRVLDVWETDLHTFLKLKSNLEMSVYCQENVLEPTASILAQNEEQLVSSALAEADMDSALPVLAAHGFLGASEREFDPDIY